MNIRTKLLLVFIPLILLMGVVLYVGKIQSDSFDDVIETLENDYELWRLLIDLNSDVKDGANALRNLLIHENPQAIERELIRLQTMNEETQETLNLLKSLASTDEETSPIIQLESIFNAVQEYEDAVIEAIQNENIASAVRIMNDHLSLLEKQFQNSVSDMLEFLGTNAFLTLENESDSHSRNMLLESILLFVLTLVSILLLFHTNWRLSSRLNRVVDVMTGIAEGKLDLKTEVEVIADDEVDAVAKAFNQMTASLDEQKRREQEYSWAQEHLAKLTSTIGSAKCYETLGETFFSEVMPLVGANHGLLYVTDERKADELKLQASYAADSLRKPEFIRFGEGLIGQCALEKRPLFLDDLPGDYVQIQSGLGKASANHLYVFPLVFEEKVRGVIEIASFKPLGKKEYLFLRESIKELAIISENVRSRLKRERLLEETQMLMKEVQKQAEALIQQREELQEKNQVLEKQTDSLKKSEEQLQSQQLTLEKLNMELQEKTEHLEKQNEQLEKAHHELELKAEELERSSTYKTQFLANMSHELRTPLNSMLLLSNLLAENKEGRLTDKEVEYAQTIHHSGKELLALINDILDLSKIEAGRMDTHISDVRVQEILDKLAERFRPLAEEKGLAFTVDVQDAPEVIATDAAKLTQILTNLLANAFKFTEKGNVSLTVFSGDRNGERNFHFAVKDTGIGIAEENKELIFQAFQQEDGSISRKYGGTGLGLSISKELADMLGGDVTLESEVGKGSTFTLVLPLRESEIGEFREEEEKRERLSMNNRRTLEEDDGYVRKRKITVERAAKNGEERRFLENSSLAASDGHEADPDPVISTETDEITRKEEDVRKILKGKNVLVDDDDIRNTYALSSFLESLGIIVHFAENGLEAIEILQENDEVDLVLMDWMMPEMDGLTALENIRKMEEFKDLPIIIITAKTVKEDRDTCFKKRASDFIPKPVDPKTLITKLEKWLGQNGTDPK